jgi:hypothetical protein
MMTLGFGVADWLMEHLPSPADASAALVLSDGEIDFLAEWFALDPESGVFVYRRGAVQQAKGWGKSPLSALLAIAEFAGPVVFDGFDASGQPVGRPWESPLVQICALSESQADSNVYSLIFEYLRANDHKAAIALGLDEGRGRLYRRAGAGKLEAVTSAAESREGQRLTFGLLDESHLATRRNGGAALARTLRRNAAKVSGRVLEVSNAPELGLGSVAEMTLADVAKGEPGILLMADRPSRIPEPTDSDELLLLALGEVYRDAPWVDRQRILAEIRDPASPWDESLRYFLNQPGGGASVLVDPRRWAALASPGGIPDGARVALGFDGSHSMDGTALAVCDESGRIELELLVERDPHDPPEWTVPRSEVHEAVAAAFERYDVTLMYADPFHWMTELEGWAREYPGRVVIFPTNSFRRFGPAVDRFRVAIAEGAVTHGGTTELDRDLSRHLANARMLRGPGRAADDGHQLYTVEKAGPGRLIDAAVAAILAFEAMATAPAVEPERESMVAWR